jgi:hypothetical protein
MLEIVTDGHHSSISDETSLNGDAEGLGFDALAVRGWCGFFRAKVAQRGCKFSLTPDQFQNFKTVGDIIDAICKDLGIPEE